MIIITKANVATFVSEIKNNPAEKKVLKEGETYYLEPGVLPARVYIENKYVDVTINSLKDGIVTAMDRGKPRYYHIESEELYTELKRAVTTELKKCKPPQNSTFIQPLFQALTLLYRTCPYHADPELELEITNLLVRSIKEKAASNDDFDDYAEKLTKWEILLRSRVNSELSTDIQGAFKDAWFALATQLNQDSPQRAGDYWAYYARGLQFDIEPDWNTFYSNFYQRFPLPKVPESEPSESEHIDADVIDNSHSNGVTQQIDFAKRLLNLSFLYRFGALFNQTQAPEVTNLDYALDLQNADDFETHFCKDPWKQLTSEDKDNEQKISADADEIIKYLTQQVSIMPDPLKTTLLERIKVQNDQFLTILLYSLPNCHSNDVQISLLLSYIENQKEYRDLFKSKAFKEADSGVHLGALRYCLRPEVDCDALDKLLSTLTSDQLKPLRELLEIDSFALLRGLQHPDKYIRLMHYFYQENKFQYPLLMSGNLHLTESVLTHIQPLKFEFFNQDWFHGLTPQVKQVVIGVIEKLLLTDLANEQPVANPAIEMSSDNLRGLFKIIYKQNNWQRLISFRNPMLIQLLFDLVLEEAEKKSQPQGESFNNAMFLRANKQFDQLWSSLMAQITDDQDPLSFIKSMLENNEYSLLRLVALFARCEQLPNSNKENNSFAHFKHLQTTYLLTPKNQNFINFDKLIYIFKTIYTDLQAQMTILNHFKEDSVAATLFAALLMIDMDPDTMNQLSSCLDSKVQKMIHNYLLGTTEYNDKAKATYDYVGLSCVASVSPKNAIFLIENVVRSSLHPQCVVNLMKDKKFFLVFMQSNYYWESICHLWLESDFDTLQHAWNTMVEEKLQNTFITSLKHNNFGLVSELANKPEGSKNKQKLQWLIEKIFVNHEDQATLWKLKNSNINLAIICANDFKYIHDRYGSSPFNGYIVGNLVLPFLEPFNAEYFGDLLLLNKPLINSAIAENLTPEHIQLLYENNNKNPGAVSYTCLRSSSDMEKIFAALFNENVFDNHERQYHLLLHLCGQLSSDCSDSEPWYYTDNRYLNDTTKKIQCFFFNRSGNNRQVTEALQLQARFQLIAKPSEQAAQPVTTGLWASLTSIAQGRPDGRQYSWQELYYVKKVQDWYVSLMKEYTDNTDLMLLRDYVKTDSKKLMTIEDFLPSNTPGLTASLDGVGTPKARIERSDTFLNLCG